MLSLFLPPPGAERHQLRAPALERHPGREAHPSTFTLEQPCGASSRSPMAPNSRRCLARWCLSQQRGAATPATSVAGLSQREQRCAGGGLPPPLTPALHPSHRQKFTAPQNVEDTRSRRLPPGGLLPYRRGPAGLYPGGSAPATSSGSCVLATAPTAPRGQEAATAMPGPGPYRCARPGRGVQLLPVSRPSPVLWALPRLPRQEGPGRPW